MAQTLTFALADVGDGDGHMIWNGSWWMWIWGPLMMIAVVVLIVWLIRVATNLGAPRTAEQREPKRGDHHRGVPGTTLCRGR